MLYRTLEALIKKGLTAGMQDKLDILFAGGRITAEEYTNLVALLPAE